MGSLEVFEKKISLVDGMLIETGGRFGENGLKNYVNSCALAANVRYRESGDKGKLLRIVDFYIGMYENETSWKYYYYEMYFLNSLRTLIEQL